MSQISLVISSRKLFEGRRTSSGARKLPTFGSRCKGDMCSPFALHIKFGLRSLDDALSAKVSLPGMTHRGAGPFLSFPMSNDTVASGIKSVYSQIRLMVPIFCPAKIEPISGLKLDTVRWDYPLTELNHFPVIH